MILYVLEGNGYQDVKNLTSLKDKSVYVNMTNRCCCNCTFCLRQTKQMLQENSLWLKREPAYTEVIHELEKYDIADFKELVFCGFGEPLTRVDDIVKVAKYIKNSDKDCLIRINTNGLSSISHGRDITVDLENLIDVISISLNAPTKEEYYALTRSIYGLDSFEYMVDFAKQCTLHIPRVVFTVVDIIGEEKIAQCKKLCNQLGIELRIRPFEE